GRRRGVDRRGRRRSGGGGRPDGTVPGGTAAGTDPRRRVDSGKRSRRPPAPGRVLSLSPTMRAVTFAVSIPRFILTRGLGRFTGSVVHGPLCGVRYGEVPVPPLPGPRWVRLKVLACGICGTDVGNLTFPASPALDPFGSFPAVPGHEVLARVEAV